MIYKQMTFLMAIFILAIAIVAPAMAQSPAPTPTAASAAASLTPVQSQAEAASAKALMQQVLGTKENSFPPPSLFTNRSAALMGVIMFIPMALIEAFSTMGQKKGQSDKAAQDIDALSKKYNIDPPTNGAKAQQQAAIARFESQGRQFYTDVIATFTKVMSDSHGTVKSSSSPDQTPSPQFPRDINAYTFTPVS